MPTDILLNLPGGGKMPVIGFGAQIFPKTPDDKVNVEEVIENALLNGYRHIDTAYFYRTEQPIGNVVKRWTGDGGKLERKDLFITTKLPFYGTHPDRIEKFLKESLKNLQLDYVDLYLIHHPIGLKYEEGKEDILQMEFEPVNDYAAIWKEMEAQVDAGRAKAIGLSNFNIPQIKKILEFARIKPACVQVLVNLYHQQKELIKFCKENGIFIVAYSPLGKYRRPGESGTRYTASDQAFILQKCVTVIPKSASPQRQRENLNVLDFKIIDEDFKRLEGLDKQGTEGYSPFALPEKWTNHPDFPTGI